MRSVRVHIPSWGYKLLLLGAAAMWGLGNVLLKGLIPLFDPSWLSGVRFLVAAVLLTIFFWPHVRDNVTADHVVVGMLVGIALFLSYYLNGIGLYSIESSEGTFLITTYTVMVPFVAWALLRVRPRSTDVLAALMCLVGVFVMSMGASGVRGGIGAGEFQVLAAAFASALQITLVARFARGRDMLALTVWQFVSAGLCGLVVGALTCPPPDFSTFSAGDWGSFVYLTVFASFGALVCQNVGLAHVPTSQGSLLLSCECLFGLVAAILIRHDVVTPAMGAGFLIVVGGLLVSEVVPMLLHKRSAAVDAVGAAGEGRG